jgi:hypothetical protein
MYHLLFIVYTMYVCSVILRTATTEPFSFIVETECVLSGRNSVPVSSIPQCCMFVFFLNITPIRRTSW